MQNLGAGQVLAGALQDNDRATIVGETTFGKGLIQTIVELSDGSAVVVTVARYQVRSASPQPAHMCVEYHPSHSIVVEQLSRLLVACACKLVMSYA